VATLDVAIKITAEAFVGKFDKGGNPYILHCLHVMYKMDPNDSELRMIAVMHDLIEDTDWTLEMLKDLGFSNRVIWGVQALTHLPNVSYEEYIKIISLNEDATKVKLADLDHNSRIMRMKGLRKKDFDRLEKYFKAAAYLRD
jgi:(p)ppGpp synthase/HD superfamily hydrolase